MDYKTSMITDEDPLRGLLFYWDLGFSHTLGSYTFLKKGDGGANTPISGERAAPFLRDPRFLTTRTPGPWCFFFWQGGRKDHAKGYMYRYCIFEKYRHELVPLGHAISGGQDPLKL